MTRGKHELKLTNPSQTPVTNLIENAVIEVSQCLDHSPWFASIHDRSWSNCIQASRALSKSIVYLTSIEYKRSLVCRPTVKCRRFFPTSKSIIFDSRSRFSMFSTPTRKIMSLILSTGCYPFSYPIETKRINVRSLLASAQLFVRGLDEEIYVIAMNLDLFVRHCFPKWSNVFMIANKVMTDLSTVDPEFYDHLKAISKIRTKVNPKVKMPTRFVLAFVRARLGLRLGNHLLGK